MRSALLVALVMGLQLPTFQGRCNGSNAVYSVIYDFSCDVDGGFPYGSSLIQGRDGNFYGVTTSDGGTTNCYNQGCGTIYRLSPDGVLTVLHTFTAGLDGAVPTTALVEGPDGAFYGTAHYGGNTNCTQGCGSIFRITTDGDFSVLHNFDGADGAKPNGDLIVGNDGHLYGTTAFGGIPDPNSFSGGTVYQITLEGVLTTLHYFETYYQDCPDGSIPIGPLVEGSDGSLYGVTLYGGSNAWFDIADPQLPSDCRFGCGTAFRIAPDGAFTIIHDFSALEGGHQKAGMIRGSDGNLYGSSYSGGPGAGGTVWSMTEGGDLTILHAFDFYDPNGFYMESILTEGADGYFYGMALTGGNVGCVVPGAGSIFRVSPLGDFDLVYAYSGTCTDGASPTGQLTIGTDGNFYGLTELGGLYGCGTVFRLGCLISLDSDFAHFTDAGGQGEVQVLASSSGNCAWTAVDTDDFISITQGASGVYSGKVVYAVSPNPSTEPRGGVIYFGQQVHLVYQDGIPCNVSPESTNLNFSATGSNGSIEVSANGPNCAWSAITNVEWITVTSPASSSGSGMVTFAVASNQSNCTSRTGSLTVAGTEIEITQAAGTGSLAISPVMVHHSAISQTGSLTVGAGRGCNWSVISKSEWVTINAGHSGTGNGNIWYTVSANLGTEPREGTIEVDSQAIAVLQDGSTPFDVLIHLDFRQVGADRCKLWGSLPLGKDFMIAGRQVTIDVGGASMTVALDERGRGSVSTGQVKLSSRKNSDEWRIKVRMRGDWRLAWGIHGMVDADISKPGTAILVPVILNVGGSTATSEVSLQYTAKAGRSGHAR